MLATGGNFREDEKTLYDPRELLLRFLRTAHAQHGETGLLRRTCPYGRRIHPRPAPCKFRKGPVLRHVASEREPSRRELVSNSRTRTDRTSARHQSRRQDGLP